MKIKKDKPTLGNCGICHLGVLHVDDYVRIEDYIRGKKRSEGVYHRKCFRDRLSGPQELRQLQSMAKNLLERASGAMSERGI